MNFKQKIAYLVAVSIIAIAGGSAVEVASAGVANPGAFTAKLTGGRVTVNPNGDPVVVDVHTTGASKIDGTIDASGRLAVRAGGGYVEQQQLHTASFGDVQLDVSILGPVTGTLDPASGRMSIDMDLGFKASRMAPPQLGANCLVGTSATPIRAQGVSTTGRGGVAYNATTGEVTLSKVGLVLPSASGCNGLDGIIDNVLGHRADATLKFKFDTPIKASGGAGPVGGGSGGSGTGLSGSGLAGGRKDEGTYTVLSPLSPERDGKSIRVLVGCNGDAGTVCKGYLKLTARKKRLRITTKQVKYSVAAGEAKAVKLGMLSVKRVNKAAKRYGKVKATVRVTPSDGTKSWLQKLSVVL